MANIEARPPLPPLRPKAIIRDILAFFRAPNLPIVPARWGKPLLILLLVVFLIDLAIDTAIGAGLSQIDKTIHNLPDAIDYDTGLVEDIVSLILLAPLLEEALFRGWLSGKIAALRFALFGVVATMGLIVATQTSLLLFHPNLMLAATLVSLGIAVVGCAQWLATRKRDADVPQWFVRHYKWLVWGSAIVFGLWHLPNYETLQSPIDAIVVLPQTLGGLFLAYTRTRMGMGAAMIHHAAFNAVWLATDRLGF